MKEIKNDLNSIKDDLNSVKNDLSSFNETVNKFNKTVSSLSGDLEDYKQQTASQLSNLHNTHNQQLAQLYNLSYDVAQLHDSKLDSCTLIREDLSCIKEDLSSLNETMNRISEDVEEHDNHTTTELMKLFTCGGIGWRRGHDRPQYQLSLWLAAH